MRLCGGAAFRKELGIERRFRDALAARVMAPTTDALHDFVGRATLGLPLFGRCADDAADGRGRLRPQGRHHLGRLPELAPRRRAATSTSSSTPTTSARSRTSSPAASTRRGTRRWPGCAAERLAARARPHGRARGHARHRPGPDLGGRRARRLDPPRPGRPRGRRRSASARSTPRRRRSSRCRTCGGAGLDRTLHVRRFDVGVGLHGDHVGGERDAARALVAGEVDAACMIDGNHLLFTQEGTLPAGAPGSSTRPAPYDHCNMTIVDTAPAARPPRVRARCCVSMSYADPEVRPLLDLEGLTPWVPGPHQRLRPAGPRRRRDRLLRRERRGDRRGVHAVTGPGARSTVLDLGPRVRARAPTCSSAAPLRDLPAGGRVTRHRRRTPRSGSTCGRGAAAAGPRLRRCDRPHGRPGSSSRGSADTDRWAGAERAGGPGATGSSPGRPAHWGLAARGALVEAGGPGAASTSTTATSSGPTSRRGCTPTPPRRSGIRRRRSTGTATGRRCRRTSRPPSCRS